MLLLSAAGVTNSPAAASPEVEKLLAEMRKAYSETKTAAFTMSASVNAPSGKLTFGTHVQYQAPNKFWVDVTASSGKGTSQSDGKAIWIKNESATSVQELPWSVDNIGRAIAGNLESLSFMDWKRQLSTEKGANMETSKLSLKKDAAWNGKKWTVLMEEAPAVDVAVDYYIDPKTKFIHRVETFSLDRKNSFASYILKDLKINGKVDEARFKKLGTKTPPADKIKI